MESVFLQILNVSIIAGWIVLAVLVLRLCFKKAPRWITCVLWSFVALRLILPFSIESAISLIPSAQTVPENIVSMDQPQVSTGVPLIDLPVNEALQSVVVSPSETPTEPTEPIQNEDATEQPTVLEQVVSAASWVWLIGVGGMILYGIISVWRVRYRVLDAVLLRDNIWQSDRIGSPFILGVFRPRIYIPYGLEDSVSAQVLAHEQSHLSRRDHWIKPVAFALLAVYWFHPLLWVAYVLLCRDIEVACDQRVLRGQTETERKEYATALLMCGVERRSIAACPLAFGEVSIKQRIKSVLSYRKPLLWVIIASLVICAVAAVCLLTVPFDEEVVVLRSEMVEPTQDHQIYGFEIDENLMEDGLDWLWAHAENPDDHTENAGIPVVLNRSKEAFDELVEALDESIPGGMYNWFKLYKYDEAYFEEKAVVWLFVPGYDEGEYSYTVNLEETNKGLRYALSLQYGSTSTFYSMPDRCQYLMLFEMGQDVVEQADSFSTRHEKAPILVPEEEDDMVCYSLGSADLDGDGEEESIRIFKNSDTSSLDSEFMVVCKTDGTPILRESIHYLQYSHCYLLPQEDGSSLLLFVEADNSDYYSIEEFSVLSVKDGVRTVLDHSSDGWMYYNSAVNLQEITTYVQLLSGWMENAQLLYEFEDESLYYGDKIGEEPRYKPLSWLDAYRNDADDSIEEILENLLASYQADTLTTVDIDLDGVDGKETLSVVRYVYSNSYHRFALLVKKADGTILTCYYLYTHYSGMNLNNSLYFYLLKDDSGKETLKMVKLSDDGYDVDDVTIDGLKDFSPMTQSEWSEYMEKTGAEMLFYIQGLELYLPDMEDTVKDYLSINADKYSIENYNEAIVTYNAFLNNRRLAYGEETSFYVSDLYATVDTSGILSYALADLTGDEVPELLTQGHGLNVFSYILGRVVHLYESPAGLETRVLSNGALWEERVGDGNHYRYTTFFEIGTTRTVSFSDPGDDTLDTSYYVKGEKMDKAEYDALTAVYFQEAQTPADLTWYTYADGEPAG